MLRFLLHKTGGLIMNGDFKSFLYVVGGVIGWLVLLGFVNVLIGYVITWV